MLLTLIASVSCLYSTTTAASTIDVNTFVFVPDGVDKTANDFHLRIGNHFTEDPKSDRLPNVSATPKGSDATFSGNTLKEGDVLTVSFKSDGVRNRPEGFFTLGGSRVSDDIKSVGTDLEEVSFVPQDGGFLANTTLINPLDTTMNVSIAAYVNAGLADQFTLDGFDTRNNARLFFSGTNLNLAPNQLLGLPAVSLSSDDYILIIGAVRMADGTSAPFALGVSPDVPEPSTVIMLGTGIAALWGRAKEARLRNRLDVRSPARPGQGLS